MTSANLVSSPAAPALTLLADLAYSLTKERSSLHFVCSLDGRFVSAFTCSERALAEWKYLCKKHKGAYYLFQGNPLEADGTPPAMLTGHLA